MNAKLYVHPMTQPTEDGQVLIAHHRLPSEETQMRIERLQDAIRCAVDWLRDGAPGRALEVLEANL